jgi:hypothetical protein
MKTMKRTVSQMVTKINHQLHPHPNMSKVITILLPKFEAIHTNTSDWMILNSFINSNCFTISQMQMNLALQIVENRSKTTAMLLRTTNLQKCSVTKKEMNKPITIRVMVYTT